MRTTQTHKVRSTAIAVICYLTVLLPGGASTSTAYNDATASSMSASAFDHPFVLRDADWWLDSTDTSTLFSDSTCTTPAATTTGSVVKCWENKRAAGQAVNTTSSGATVSPSLIGTEAPLRFAGGSELTGPDLFGGSLSDVNIFVVLRENVRVQNFLLNLGGTASSSRMSLHAPWSDGRWYVDLGDTSTNRAKSTGAPTVVGEIVLLTAWKDSAAGSNGFRVNSTSDYVSSGSTSTATTAGITLGSASRHDIAEVLIYGTRLSAAEEAEVEQYLTAKWGL